MTRRVEAKMLAIRLPSPVMSTARCQISEGAGRNRASKNLGAKRHNIMFGIILPAALPQIITGLKVMLGIAWTCVISAELIAAREGLGFMIMNGKEYFQTDTVVLGMVMISITVLLTDLVMRIIERRLVSWQD